eukprot:265543-Prorocentrum_minimum.AAC.3
MTIHTHTKPEAARVSESRDAWLCVHTPVSSASTVFGGAAVTNPLVYPCLANFFPAKHQHGA